MAFVVHVIVVLTITLKRYTGGAIFFFFEMYLNKTTVVLIILYLKLMSCLFIMKQAVVVYKNKDTTNPPLSKQMKKNLQEHFITLLKSKYVKTLIPKLNIMTIINGSVDLGRKMEPATIKFYNSNFSQFLNFDASYYNATAGDENTKDFATSEDCPAYDVELEKFLVSKKYSIAHNIYQPLMESITNYTNVTIDGFSALEKLYTSIERLPMKQWPSWMINIDPLDLYLAACYSYAIPTDTPKLARLSIGGFIKYIINSMVMLKEDHNQNLTTKIRLYQADAYTVAGILNAMEKYNFLCPEEYSAVFFELHEEMSSGRNYVTILYRNSTVLNTLASLPIPGCGLFCPVDRFLTIYEEILPEDRAEECSVSPNSNEWVITMLAILCVMFISSYAYSKIMGILKQRSQQPVDEIEMADMNTNQ